MPLRIIDDISPERTHAVIMCLRNDANEREIQFMDYFDLWKPDIAAGLISILRNGGGYEIDVELVGF